MRRLCVLGLLVAAACAAPTDPPAGPADDAPPAADAPPATDTPPPAHAPVKIADVVCTSLPLTAEPVPMLEVPGDAPASTGGTIALGTYDLTHDIFYMGDLVHVRRIPQDFTQTVRFGEGGKLEVATLDTDGTSYALGRWQVSGTKLLSMEECPEAGHFGAPSYTATDTELVVRYGDEVLVYTKR